MRYIAHPKLTPEQTKQAPERRKEPRVSTHGRVIVRIAGPLELVVPARLIDVSVNGFRIRHNEPSIVPGTELALSYSWGEVRARVIWCRSEDGWTDSGLFVP